MLNLFHFHFGIQRSLHRLRMICTFLLQTFTHSCQIRVQILFFLCQRVEFVLLFDEFRENFRIFAFHFFGFRASRFEILLFHQQSYDAINIDVDRGHVRVVGGRSMRRCFSRFIAIIVLGLQNNLLYDAIEEQPVSAVGSQA